MIENLSGLSSMYKHKCRKIYFGQGKIVGMQNEQLVQRQKSKSIIHNVREQRNNNNVMLEPALNGENEIFLAIETQKSGCL